MSREQSDSKNRPRFGRLPAEAKEGSSAAVTRPQQPPQKRGRDEESEESLPAKKPSEKEEEESSHQQQEQVKSKETNGKIAKQGGTEDHSDDYADEVSGKVQMWNEKEEEREPDTHIEQT